MEEPASMVRRMCVYVQMDLVVPYVSHPRRFAVLTNITALMVVLVLNLVMNTRVTALLPPNLLLVYPVNMLQLQAVRLNQANLFALITGSASKKI